MEQKKLLIKNASQVVKVCGKMEKMLVGEAMKKIEILNAISGSGLSIVANW